MTWVAERLSGVTRSLSWISWLPSQNSGGRRPSKVGGTPGTARKDVSTSVMLVDWMGVGTRVNEEQEDWDRLVEEYLIKVENTTGSTSKEDNILILEDDLRKEEDLLLVEDDLGDPANLHDDHHGHKDQEHIPNLHPEPGPYPPLHQEDGIPDQGGEQLTPISQDDMIHLRGVSTMNTMGASLNKYFVQSRRLEVESVDKEVWDNTTSQKAGQTVRDAKGGRTTFG